MNKKCKFLWPCFLLYVKFLAHIAYERQTIFWWKKFTKDISFCDWMRKNRRKRFQSMIIYMNGIYVYAERDGDVWWSMSEWAEEGRHNSATEARILHLWSAFPPHQVSRVLQAVKFFYESLDWNTTNVMLNNKSTIHISMIVFSEFLVSD